MHHLMLMQIVVRKCCLYIQT